jgi:ABC-type nitrate/sulfonate/bicarbonate transport system substrate-binding protein
MAETYLRKACLRLISAVFVPLLALSHANAQDRIQMGYATSSGQAAPLWITQDGGFFKKNNLDVELIYMQGGVRVVQGIISGTLTVGWGGGADLIQARLAGGDIKIIAAFNDSIPYKLIAAKNISRAE